MRRPHTRLLLGAMLVLGIASPFLLAAHRSSGSTATKTSVAANSHPASANSKKSKGHHHSKKVHGQKAPTADRITEIQQALARDGAYTGKPTGKWDAASVAAMKRFQDGHGLNPSGKLDALSLQKLGLGSEIAGVAAPIPAASIQRPTADPE